VSDRRAEASPEIGRTTHDECGAARAEPPAVTTEALVLTHNAPASLERCLAAIAAQTTPPTAILIVDNASDPPVDPAKIELGIPTRVIRSESNLGPAGGWAIALSDFVDDAFGFAWVMDDDIVPAPDCLERLQSRAAKVDGPAFVTPLSNQPDGTVGQYGSWCGLLIAQEIVQRVGVPRAELFWWAEDTEYCHWRIPQAGYPRVVAQQAVVRHDAIRQRAHVPNWKYYYETRNMIYLHLHVMHRVGWFPRNFTRLMGRALLREKRGYLRRFVAIARGAFDGLVGRLGIRYPVVPMRERTGTQRA
jgi:GT2 family glycosyltransferase